MADPQLGRLQDDGRDAECLRQTQSRRGQPPAGRYLWTGDSSVASPVADSNNHQEVQRSPRRACTRDDIGICPWPDQAVDSKYETSSRRCLPRLPAPVPPRKCVNNDNPSAALQSPPVKATRPNDSLPSPARPAPGSESKMMQHPETRPISQEQLVAEVKSIYAGLVMVETKCIEVDKAQSTQGRLTLGEWQQLTAFHRYLLHEDDDPFNTYSDKTSNELGALLSEVSLRSRSFCRLNSRLQPLLKAAERTPSYVQFVEFMTLIGTLSDILRSYSSLLDFEDTILKGLFDLITSIIRRLSLRFRSAYEELKCRNASTQIIFEFPNNMRHVCTTMPWTILPALLVLWGVCWMFILGPGDLEPEKFKAPVPTFSPAPAVYDLLDNSGPAYYDFGLQSVFMPESSTTGFNQHPTIDSLPFGNDGAGVDPIYLVQAAPQDPLFLSFDVLPRNSAEITETSSKDGLTEALPATVTPDPILHSYGDMTSQEQFNPMANVASVDQGVQNTSGQKSTSSFTEAHKGAIPSPEQSFPCPNRGCKRHLPVCKHNPNVSVSSVKSDGTEEQSVSHPVSTPALPAELQPASAEPLSEGSSGESSVRKRSRSENDDDWSEESLLREMKKKLKRMAQEVKEKEDAYLQAREGLESIQKTIQVMEDLLRKS
ncbi:uncharacterized protein FTJAE_4900 [Fusarium tjaetaba]|uniref:Uncharacterized protein n=1 Tax=Fusarium tjaetaba TaxID=1567544 RepID=A0A8H5RW83_9HYPO|nr:uncharacterized protein FTJAE_4900 [Fusarium tjaetaba]KAF5639562.1 hypothetical protein FTJAE_4900 [Fusarium tjaetaba]